VNQQQRRQLGHRLQQLLQLDSKAWAILLLVRQEQQAACL
jgi:hypothetical protein